jgi:hypothetical protein
MGSVAVDTPWTKEDEENPNWNLTEVDRMLLRQTDEEYEPHSWNELKQIICMLLIPQFHKVPIKLTKHTKKPTTASNSSSASPLT